MDLSTHDSAKPGFNQPAVMEMNAGQNAPQLEELQALIKKFAPLVYFHPGEEMMPVPVESYLQKSFLVNSTTKAKSPAAGMVLPDDGQAYYLELKEGVVLSGDKKPAKGYVHAKANGRYTDLQYWFFYAHTGSASAVVKWLIDGTIKGYEGKISLDPLGKFNGSWERITLRINNGTREAEQVFFPRQGNGGWIDFDRVERRGSQVLAYASKGNYAFYPALGFNHPGKARFNLYSSQLEFCIQHDIGKGRALDFSDSCELVSAGYLGTDQPAEPAWLSFMHSWGNPAPDYLASAAIKRMVMSTFGKTLEFLLSREILDGLVNYLLSHYKEECRSKCLAPKAQKCWHGDESD